MLADNVKYFAEKLKDARNKHEITQRQLGEMLGKTYDQVSQMERGIRLPSKQEFMTLCDLFNVTDEYFFPNNDMPELKEETWRNDKRGKRDNGNRFGGKSRQPKPSYFDSKPQENSIDKIEEREKSIEKTEVIQEANKPIVKDDNKIESYDETYRRIVINIPSDRPNNRDIVITIEEKHR